MAANSTSQKCKQTFVARESTDLVVTLIEWVTNVFGNCSVFASCSLLMAGNAELLLVVAL